jgi:hypothetical protein
MTGRPEFVAAATGSPEGPPLPPGARALLRWLPTQQPSGAFAGQHDQVHVPGSECHARVSLWWSDGVVHPGDRVGPPRGGLVPGRSATYSVALPRGGYLWINEGVLLDWRAQSMSERPVVRADGQVYDSGRYSAVQPYFRRHYERMTRSSVRAALTALGHEPAVPADVSRVLEMITTAGDPIVCGCTGRTPTGSPAPLGLVVPESLLVDPGTIRVLVGEADAVESAATLWRLSSLIWDPVRVGRALAAESVARTAGESSRGWPQAPITEQTVAHIAAQAIRYHGAPLVLAMPSWLLGWVMVAAPVLGAADPSGKVRAAALEAADRVRVARVETQWHAMAATRLLLSRASQDMHALDDPSAPLWRPAGDEVIDLRRTADATRPDATDDPVSGMPLREAVRRAFHCDVRTWFGVIAEHQ